jgi:hypothetical protein
MNLKSKSLIHGEATVTVCDISSKEAQKMMREIEYASKRSWSEYRELLDRFHSLFQKRQFVLTNKVVDRGLEMLARSISGDVVYTGAINYCAVGTGTLASAAGDTQLGTETARKLVSSTTFSGPIAYISTFFTQAEAIANIREIGHFVDGTGTANSGRLYSRIGDPDTAELPVNKTALDTLTVDYRCTFSSI